MLNENLLEYISENIKDSIEITNRYVPKYGWLGIIKIDDIEKYRTGKFYDPHIEVQAACKACPSFIGERRYRRYCLL